MSKGLETIIYFLKLYILNFRHCLFPKYLSVKDAITILITDLVKTSSYFFILSLHILEINFKTIVLTSFFNFKLLVNYTEHY